MKGESYTAQWQSLTCDALATILFDMVLCLLHRSDAQRTGKRR